MTIRYTIITLLLIISSVRHGCGQTLPYTCTGFMESYGVQGTANSVFIWTVDGGQIVNGQGNDTIIIRWDNDRRSHTLSVIEQTEFGCFGIPVEATVDINAPVADIGDNVEVCEDDLYPFDATTSYLTSVTYQWSDGSTNPTYQTGTEGYVWVKITGTDHCFDYDSAYLTVNPLPVVDLGNDTALCGTSTLTLDPGFYSNYRWSTGDISNTLTVDGRRTEPETIWVEVTDEHGCQGYDTLLLEVCDIYILFANMPNAITPGDKNGQNDRWEIPNIDLFPDALLEIYDRWGRLVYRTDDIFNNPWNGESMSGKELPMDAYYFVLDLKVSNVKPMTGYVNVIR